MKIILIFYFLYFTEQKSKGYTVTLGGLSKATDTTQINPEVTREINLVRNQFVWSITRLKACLSYR